MLETRQNATVLVTGGSGYLAGWVIVTLIGSGYRVRTTLRHLGRESEVRTAIARHVAANDRLEFVTADLLDDAGWPAAMDGVGAVIHTASPMPIGEFARADIVRPAREGTLRVLEAARAAGVGRVVITSSGLAAVTADRSPDGIARSDETVWTDLESGTINAYTRAKTLAERDAWAFAASQGAPEVATILPGFILGPVMSSDIGGSMGLIVRMLNGKMPAVPRIGFSMVDVRDLADLHVRAMTAPEAAGQRFIGSGPFYWLREIADILRSGGLSRSSRVSSRAMPDLLMRTAGLVNAEVRQLVPILGKQRSLDAGKALRLLGWSPRPIAETVLDGARSLESLGVL